MPEGDADENQRPPDDVHGGPARDGALERSLDSFLLDPALPARARRAVAWLRPYVSSLRGWDLDLLVSELVTHAVLQARPGDEAEWLGVCGLLFPDRVRVEISRPGSWSPLPGGDGSSSRGGVTGGLWFVERLSDARGAESDGAVLWLEVRR